MEQASVRSSGQPKADHAAAKRQQQRPLLDPLPDGVLHEVLSHVQWPARTTCRAFRSHIDAGRASLDLRWPTSPAQLPALHALLARLPHLHSLAASGDACPVDGLAALAVPTLTALTLTEGSAQQHCTTVVDLTPLTRCTSLVKLDLSHCICVADVSPLMQCSALTSVVLKNFRITDLTPLVALTGLQSLSLEECSRIHDLGPLASCTALTDVNIGRCDSIVDLTPLGSCSLLATLDAGDCHAVTCASPLTACKLLSSLHLGGEELGSSAPLAAMTSLRCLRLLQCGSPLADGLRFLTGLKALDSVTLGEVRYSDIAPLSECRKLTSVWLNSCTGAASLTPLAALPGLAVLGLGYSTPDDTTAPDLHPLAACTLLRCLFLSSSGTGVGPDHVIDVHPLGACRALSVLDLGGRDVADLRPLARCPALADLRLWSCARTLTDLSPLSGCSALTILELSWQWGGAWHPVLGSLAGCMALQTLDIRTLQHVDDVSVLAAPGAFPSLTCLALDCQRVLDLSCLAGCTSLELLQLCGGGAREVDTSCLAGLTGLSVEHVR